MSEWDEFTDESIMPFGKHRGKPLGEVPADYLVWLLEQDWATSDKWEGIYRYALNNEKALMQEVEEQSR